MSIGILASMLFFGKKKKLAVKEVPASELPTISVAEHGSYIRKVSWYRFVFVILFLVLLASGLSWLSKQPELANHQELAKGLQEASTLFFVTIITSLIFEIALRRTFFKEINFEIWNNFTQYFGKAHSINTSGIEAVWDHFPAKRIEDGFSKAEREILIIQTWFSNISPIEEAITTAFKNSDECTVRIFLINPDSEEAKRRGEESSLATPNILPDSVRQAEKMMNALAIKIKNGQCSHKIGTFRYDCTPTISVFKHDDKIFWGPYFKGRRTWETTWFELTTEKTKLHGLIELYIKYIEDHSKEYVPDEFVSRKRQFGYNAQVATPPPPPPASAVKP